MKHNKSLFLFLSLILISTLFISGIKTKTEIKGEEKISYSTLLSMVENNEIKELNVDIQTGKLTYILRDKEAEKSYILANPTYFHDSVEKSIIDINKKAKKDSGKITLNYVKSTDWTTFLSVIPTVIFVLVAVMMLLPLLKIKKGNREDSDSEGISSFMFGKRKFVPTKSDIKFDAVAGADEEKLELKEVVDFLKEPEVYTKAGARIPKGILMVGPPGTGKTLLARAVAGEAGVPFFSISGSDFVEMYVGVGAQRVRTLFKAAKKTAPSIIFIDEIDAVGKKRGAEGQSNSESENTLNQLLVEMDGFSKNENVIVIAATNRPEMLDNALQRPGRFDRQVVVNLPDVKGREEILKVHAKNKLIGPDINLSDVAASCSGFSGADIENLLNEATLLSIREGNKQISQKNIDDAILKVVMGTEKKSSIISNEDKKITAYHEAGHAVVSYFLPTQEDVHQISIIPRGLAAGFTMYKNSDEHQNISDAFVLDSICSLMGGRAGERLIDKRCAGASNDIERATDLARKYITDWGFSSKFGPIKLNKELSEQTKSDIDKEVNDIIATQYKRALQIVKEHSDEIEDVIHTLIEKEKISGDEFREMMSRKI